MFRLKDEKVLLYGGKDNKMVRHNFSRPCTFALSRARKKIVAVENSKNKFARISIKVITGVHVKTPEIVENRRWPVTLFAHG